MLLLLYESAFRESAFHESAFRESALSQKRLSRKCTLAEAPFAKAPFAKVHERFREVLVRSRNVHGYFDVFIPSLRTAPDCTTAARENITVIDQWSGFRVASEARARSDTSKLGFDML